MSMDSGGMSDPPDGELARSMAVEEEVVDISDMIVINPAQTPKLPSNPVSNATNKSLSYKKLLYNDQHWGPYIVFVESDNSTKHLANLHPMALGRLFYESKIPDINKISRRGRNRVQVEFKTRNAANSFQSNPLLGKKELKAFIPTSNIHRVGVVRGIGKSLTEDDIKAFIDSSVPVGEVQRMKRRIYKDISTEYVSTDLEMSKKEAIHQRKVIRVVGKDEKARKASEKQLFTDTESDESDDSDDDDDNDNLHLKEIKPGKNGGDADLHGGCVWEGVDALEFPEDVMFPEEYNRFLRDKLDILTSENGRMRRSLEELEAELNQLKERQLKDQDIQLMSPLAGLGRASELASSKIVELSKRVRELTAEVEILRTRCRTAETKLALQQDKLDDVAKQSQELRAEEPKGKDEVKILTEKLQVANTKLCECRNQNQSLRQELKLAHKALVNEVGDSVPLVTVLNMSSNWRGRAQQILTLQQKVAELQEQLTDKPASVSSIENRNLSSMRQKEKDRRIAQEQTNQELKDTKALLEETNRKLEGFKARAKALETEMAGLKTRLNSLLEKAKHDDQLIALLSNEVSTAECRMKNQDQTFQQDMERMNAEHERLEQEISKEKCKVGQLEATLTDKQAVIERLTQQIQNVTLQLEMIPNRPKTRDDDSIPRSPASSKPSSQHDCMQSPTTSECQILSQAAEAERVRLLELLAVMNRRLDEQRCVAAQAEEAFRRERHKAARLETKVARLELEKVGTSRVPSYGNSRRMQEREAIVEELNSRIELLEEEILALRTRVQCIQQEKQDDLRTYTSLLEQARSTFLRAQRSQTSIKKNKNISL